MEKLGVFFYLSEKEERVVDIFRTSLSSPIEVYQEKNTEWELEHYLRVKENSSYSIGCINIFNSNLRTILTEELIGKKTLYKIKKEYPIPNINTLISDELGYFLEQKRLSDMLLFLEEVKLDGYCFAHNLDKFPNGYFKWILLGLVHKHEGKYRAGINKVFFEESK